ncbi:mannose/fructose-specific phosphotransferase system component IIA [Streptomyces sp. V3I7]|nr:mannose/fructose-specific phosphotransferase system component IIA [Streptomyces sp. V3I7]
MAKQSPRNFAEVFTMVDIDGATPQQAALKFLGDEGFIG